MAVWPFLMAVTAGLTVWGWLRGAWIVPALALLGYIGMRGVMWGLPDVWHEVAACTLWLCISCAMVYNRGYVPGFFYALSGLCYPVFLLIGFPMEFMGVSLIAAEAFALCALLGIGGGLIGMDRDTPAYRGGFLFWPDGAKVGVAARQAGAIPAFWRKAE